MFVQKRRGHCHGQCKYLLFNITQIFITVYSLVPKVVYVYFHIEKKKYCIWEALNLLKCADNSKDTNMDRNRHQQTEADRKNKNNILFHVSGITCHMTWTGALGLIHFFKINDIHKKDFF